jgi:hypothetical protein
VSPLHSRSPSSSFKLAYPLSAPEQKNEQFDLFGGDWELEYPPDESIDSSNITPRNSHPTLVSTYTSPSPIDVHLRETTGLISFDSLNAAFGIRSGTVSASSSERSNRSDHGDTYMPGLGAGVDSPVLASSNSCGDSPVESDFFDLWALGELQYPLMDKSPSTSMMEDEQEDYELFGKWLEGF